MSRYTSFTLREVSNNNLPGGENKPIRPISFPAPSADAVPPSDVLRGSSSLSPHVDRRNRRDGVHCTEVVAEVAEMFFTRERTTVRNSNYLASQPEINEKMRMILVDWLVDVHLKFKLHEETFFLAVDILDRYLSLTRSTRQMLQLIGITAILIASKYEEMWAPEVRDCIHISANTYTRDDILKCERAICTALQFRFTTPTPYPFVMRLLTVCAADETLQNMTFFYLEHAVLEYRYLQYLPSQIANASLYLANIALRREPWNAQLQYYSKATVSEFRSCAETILQFVNFVVSTKYQAVRRKYTNTLVGDITARSQSVELPPM